MTKLESLAAIKNHANFNEFVIQSVLDPKYAHGRLFANCQDYKCVNLEMNLFSELELQFIKDESLKSYLDYYMSERLVKCTQSDRENILRWLDSDDLDSFSSFFKNESYLMVSLRLALNDVFDTSQDDLIYMFKNRLAKFVFPIMQRDGFSDRDAFKAKFDRVFPDCCKKFLSDCHPSSDKTLVNGILTLNFYVASNELNSFLFNTCVLTSYLDYFYSFDD